jgi:hypothetical protein
MSVVSVILNEASKEVLSGITGVVKDALGNAKGKLTEKLPTAAALVDSVQRQTQFKTAYRALSTEGQEAVDAMLLTICTAALIKARKALGI